MLFGLAMLVIFVLSVLTTIIVFVPITANAYDNSNNYDVVHPYGSITSPYNDSTNNNYNNPLPMIYTVNPNSATALNKSIFITLTGDKFIPGSQAKFDNAYRPTSYTDANHLTVALNSGDLNMVGNHIITVYNGAPGGGNSNEVIFTVRPRAVAIVNSTNTYNNTSNNTNSYNYNNDSSYNTLDQNSTTSPVTPTKTSTTTSESLSNLAANAIFGSNGFLPSGLIQWLFVAIFILLAVILVRKLYGVHKYNATPLKHQ